MYKYIYIFKPPTVFKEGLNKLYGKLFSLCNFGEV